MRGFYFVTDALLSRQGIFHDVKEALAAAVTWVQYRNKTADTAILVNEALKLRVLCKGARLLINDRVDVALAVGADGVHLGQLDMPVEIARRLLGKKKIIGLTVHTLAQARKAFTQGVNYLGVAPIFATATKKDAGFPVGTGLIRRIKQEVPLPLVAIGGITLQNASEVIGAGADAISALSAVIRSESVKERILSFQGKFSPDK